MHNSKYWVTSLGGTGVIRTAASLYSYFWKYKVVVCPFCMRHHHRISVLLEVRAFVRLFAFEHNLRSPPWIGLLTVCSTDSALQSRTFVIVINPTWVPLDKSILEARCSSSGLFLAVPNCMSHKHGIAAFPAVWRLVACFVMSVRMSGSCYWCHLLQAPLLCSSFRRPYHFGVDSPYYVISLKSCLVVW